MATKKLKKPSNEDLVEALRPSGIAFGIGFSPISDKIYAGKIKEGREFVGKKHDVSFTFVNAVLAWIAQAGDERRIYAGEYVYTLTVTKKKHGARPAKARAK